MRRLTTNQRALCCFIADGKAHRVLCREAKTLGDVAYDAVLNELEERNG